MRNNIWFATLPWTNTFWETIRYNVPRRPRHPLVVWNNKAMATATGLLWLAAVTTGNAGTEVHCFFLAQFNLYCVSTWYHTIPEDATASIIDQTCIGLFIMTAVVPFVGDEPLAVGTIITCSALMTWFKVRNYEAVIRAHWGWRTAEMVGSLIFLGCGVLALTLYLTMGSEPAGSVFWFAILFFLGKLAAHVFHDQCCWVPDHIEKGELGHWLCLTPAIALFDYHVLTSVVWQ